MSAEPKGKPKGKRRSNPSGKRSVGNKNSGTESNQRNDEIPIPVFIPLSEEELQQCMISDEILEGFRRKSEHPVNPRDELVLVTTTSFRDEENVKLWRRIRSMSSEDLKTMCYDLFGKPKWNEIQSFERALRRSNTPGDLWVWDNEKLTYANLRSALFYVNRRREEEEVEAFRKLLGDDDTLSGVSSEASVVGLADDVENSAAVGDDSVFQQFKAEIADLRREMAEAKREAHEARSENLELKQQLAMLTPANNSAVPAKGSLAELIQPPTSTSSNDTVLVRAKHLQGITKISELSKDRNILNSQFIVYSEQLVARPAGRRL